MTDDLYPIQSGKDLQAWRKAMYLTSEQVSKVFNVTHNTVQRWECGLRRTDWRVIDLACRYIDDNLSEIMRKVI